MRQHRTIVQPHRPRPNAMRAFFQRLALAQPDDDTPASEPAAPRPLYTPANDPRDLDQRVREVGEW
jgi:hypothetical protein